MKDSSRVDIALVEQALADSREQAKRMVMAGCVYADEEKINKPSQIIKSAQILSVKGYEKEFVSRGGFKLKKAIAVFDIHLKNKICADIGASTGGFTDCMLQNGASHVYAIDTGYGQMAYTLRNDERVSVFERCNARYLKENSFDQLVDFVSIDVSFISLRLILPAVKKILKVTGEIICLIKPQFEAGREKVGKNGVVREPNTHVEVINNVIAYAAENSFYAKGLSFSPIKGPEGNIEYLLFLSQKASDFIVDSKSVVSKAWQELSLC